MLLDIDYQPSQGLVGKKNAYQVHHPLPPLSHWVQCLWQLDVPEGAYHYRTMPDNSVDWIINLNDPEDTVLVSPFSSSMGFDLNGPTSYFGIRFRILGHHGLITQPLGEWGGIDYEVSPIDLLPFPIFDSILTLLLKSKSFSGRCKDVSRIILSSVRNVDIDPRLSRYIRYCCKQTSSNLSLSDKQCSEFGVSARQLRRLTHLHLGLVPKDFAKVVRFQRTLRGIIQTGQEGAWANYYYDQPHFIREFKDMAGMTPSEFHRMSVLYNKDRKA